MQISIQVKMRNSSIFRIIFAFLSLSLTAFALSNPLYSYVVNAQSNTITTYLIDSQSGALTQKGPPLDNTGGLNPQSMVTDSLHHYLYVADSSKPVVLSYTIDKTDGHLTPLPKNQVVVGLDPWSIRLSPDDRYAYVANNNETTISQFRIAESDGRLIPLNPPKLNVPDCIAPAGNSFDWSGQHFYLSCLNSNKVKIFNFNSQNGILTPAALAEINTGVNPRMIKFDKFDNAYVINQSNATISLFSHNNVTGALRPKAPYTFLTHGMFPSMLYFSLNNRSMLVLHRLSKSMSIFTWDSKTQAFSKFVKSQAVGIVHPGSAAFDDSNHLYVLDHQGSSISQYSIDANGNFKPLKPAVVLSNPNPWSMEISESTASYY